MNILTTMKKRLFLLTHTLENTLWHITVIKRDESSNANNVNLSKNQIYKHTKQINKAFIFIFSLRHFCKCLSFIFVLLQIILVCSYQRFILSTNELLFRKCLINISAIRTILQSLNYLKVSFYTSTFEDNEYLQTECFSILLLCNRIMCIQTIYQNSFEGNLWICKLVHTSYRKQQINVITGRKVEKNVISSQKVKW